MNEWLAVLADPNSTLEQLDEAIAHLDKAGESPGFWSAIANSPDCRPEHRRLAVRELFKRHVKPGMTLAELGELLDDPTWLADDDVSAVTAVGGKVPVSMTPGDSVFVVALFPKLPGEQTSHWAIYLRVEGKVEREGLLQALRDGSGPAAGRKLLEIGLFTGSQP